MNLLQQTSECVHVSCNHHELAPAYLDYSFPSLLMLIIDDSTLCRYLVHSPPPFLNIDCVS